MKQSKTLWFLSLLVVCSMLLSACAAPTQVAQEPQVVKETEIVKETQIVEVEKIITATPEPKPEYTGANKELQAARAGEYEGTSVTIFGNYTAQDEAKFRAALEPFIASTGIDVQFEGSADFAQLITVRVEAGDAPDIAELSQPALMQQLAEEGKLVDMTSFMDQETLKKDFAQSWLDLGAVDGKLYGIFYRANTKSIVWYPIAAFEEKGYAVPQTWDELTALSDKIVADGSSPWCVSIEHSSSTGWVATDWLEDIILRMHGAEFYDKWAKHEVPFNSPEVVEAMDELARIWFTDKYVYGGKDYILSTWVGQTQDPMFDEAGPQCWMHRQAGWYSSFFPEGKAAGVDSTFFYLPGMTEDNKPVLGAGDMVVMFNDRPEVRAVMQYLAAPEGGKVWAMAGGFISPNRSMPLDWFTDPIDKAQTEILQNASVLRFDTSDMMPAEVGTGSFWTGMVDWVNAGGANTQEVLDAIEASWPK